MTDRIVVDHYLLPDPLGHAHVLGPRERYYHVLDRRERLLLLPGQAIGHQTDYQCFAVAAFVPHLPELLQLLGLLVFVSWQIQHPPFAEPPASCFGLL